MSTTPPKIIIPPKNIFKINHQIVKSNAINRVEVNAYESTSVKKDGVAVFNKTNTYTDKDFPDYNSKWIQAGSEYYGTSDALSGRFVESVYIALRPTYKTITVQVPKVIDTTLVLEILHSFELQGTEEVPDIKHTLYLEKTTEKAVYEYPGKGANDTNIGTTDWTLENPEIITIKTEGKTTTDVTATEFAPDTVVTPEGFDTPKAEITFVDDTDIKTPTYTKETNYYEVTFKVLVGYEQYILSGKSTAVGSDLPIPSFFLNGYRYTYKPRKIVINIYGTILSIDLKEVTKTAYGGEINKDSTGIFSIERNELLQTANTYNGLNAIDNNSAKVINAYKDGKETATLLCSVDNYYDKDGNEVISIKNDKPMLFKRHDIVIPYIGKDRPMSTYSDGTPKSFMVLKSRIYSKGVVWQELTIQEI